MSTPDALEKFRSEPGIRSYRRCLKKVIKELQKLNAVGITVDLLSKEDSRSALRRAFSLEKANDADHSLIVEGLVLDRLVRVTAPFRRGLALPYSVEIGLRSKVDFQVTLRRNILLASKWEFSPNLPKYFHRPAELATLKLPDVGWRHDSGGIPIGVPEGGRIAPSTRKDLPSTWTVFSAYQGFLFNVGPRIAKYVEAAPRLDALLAGWNAAPAEAPAAPRPPRKQEPAAAPVASPAAPAAPPRPQLSALDQAAADAAAVVREVNDDDLPKEYAIPEEDQ